MLPRSIFVLALIALASPCVSVARTQEGMGGQQMPGMDQKGQHHDSQAAPQTLIAASERHATSGTSSEPNSTPADMLMTMRGHWMFMVHGEAFLNFDQQSGPRGDDKVFSTNWVMPMAQRKLGRGTLTLRTMLSLEPATVTRRFYPELFQQGETAYGKPIVDGQHPHDFVMELAALYDLKLGDNALLSFYFAPVGDPAMGPTAYPHRASASEDPIATLGHHLEDSTHISNDVVTAGVTYKVVRLEASGFRGREPDEYRWDIDSGKIDSWSVRATVSPAQNWSGQFSFAHLAGPEALHPSEDVNRMTASIMYNRPLARGNWASTLLWGRNHTSDDLTWNGYLLESTLRFLVRNYLWTRIDNADRTNELLLRNQVEPPNFHESTIGRVQAYTVGYEREFQFVPHVSTGIGGQITAYSTPSGLASLYGHHPVGAVLFLRFRLGR
ncbi:MAG: hypothetical protein ACRD3E_19380 [Terriglobales bacterium]